MLSYMAKFFRYFMQSQINYILSMAIPEVQSILCVAVKTQMEVVFPSQMVNCESHVFVSDKNSQWLH